MGRQGTYAKLTPLDIELDSLKVDGLDYYSCKVAAGWGNGSLDPSRLTAAQKDFVGLHGDPPLPRDGWQSAHVLEDSSDELLGLTDDERSDGMRPELDALVLALSALMDGDGRGDG